MAGLNGSGINSADITAWFSCGYCDTEMELEGRTNDTHTQAFTECPDCGETLEADIPSREELAADYYGDQREGK